MMTLLSAGRIDKLSEGLCKSDCCAAAGDGRPIHYARLQGGKREADFGAIAPIACGAAAQENRTKIVEQKGESIVMSLEGRVAIVTGAGGGLGRSHAHFLAGQGAKVVVNDVDLGAAQHVADELAAQGGTALAIAASVTDEAAIDALVARTIEAWGRIDILVNNAGILRDKSFANMSLAEFRLVVDVHLIGSAICSKAVWATMREQGYGRIVMTTSSSGLYGNFGQANYAAAKMALVGLMQTLAIEGEKYGIRVNCLAPTAATSMTSGVLSEASLERFDPALVSPGLLALVGSNGVQIGGGPDAAQQVIAHWEEISDRTGEVVPEYGFFQAERELAGTGATGPVSAVVR
jgi:NAD(P)-dependent dehydrogenase (short-subunit alcohol dehydrogenase family)